MASSAGPEIERLIGLLAKLPGMGPRSARRATLALLKKREQLMEPLAQSLAETAAKVRPCSICAARDRASSRSGSVGLVQRSQGYNVAYCRYLSPQKDARFA